MLKFVLLKLLNKKWMILALLIGNILLISVVGAGTMYSDAALQRSLNQRFQDQLAEHNAHPFMVEVSAVYPSTMVSRTQGLVKGVKALPQKFGLAATQIVEHYSSGLLKTAAIVPRENGMDDKLAIGTLTNLEDHIEIVNGRLYETQPDKDGIVDVIVSQQGFRDMNLLLDECFTLGNIRDENGNKVVFRVCGVFRSKAATEDLYWVNPPSSFVSECLMDYELFYKIFMADGSYGLDSTVNVMLDFTAVTTDRVAELLETALKNAEYYKSMPKVTYRDTFQNTLSDHIVAEKQVTVAIWVLQVPIFMLLAAFLFMVSRQILEMEQNEISVLKSRGASRGKLLGVYVIQSLLICLTSMAAGLPLSIFLVQVLGSANEFLEFVGRTALPLQINSKVVVSCSAAALVSVCTMVLPVFRYANVTIVNHMQRKHRRSNTPMWQKLFLDVILLGVSLYGLYTFNSQKEELAVQVLNNGILNPLLFICSSLFILGAALLALRIIPAITFIVFRLFRRWWSPALYTTFLQLIRNRGGQAFIVVFLIMTMALGIFNTQTARTINHYAEENIQYTTGADIVLQEKWHNNMNAFVLGRADELIYYEPDYSRYEALVGNGAAGVTRVRTSHIGIIKRSGKSIEDLQVMGIHTPTFGPVVWMKNDLLTNHLYEYLNAMSRQKEGILISRNLQVELGLELGQLLIYKTGETNARGVICGVVDYWPAYNPIKYVENADGSYSKMPNYLVVANIDYLNGEAWDLRPYEVWIRAEEDNDFIYDFVEEQKITLESFRDTPDKLIRLKNDPLFQGTNGVLTVSFVMALILCSVGFLIYWILSIKARSLQFGIYRAMGMSMGEVLLMLFGEQIFISGTSIGSGILVGSLAAKYYIPLIQIAYSDANSALPLELISESNDLFRLLIVVGAVMLVCMVILGVLISKLKITQALKLGED